MKKIAAIIGTIMILFAVFGATVKVPVMGGDEGYIYTGVGSIIFTIVIFLIALVLIIRKKYSYLYIPGVLSILKVGFIIYYAENVLTKIRDFHEAEFIKNNKHMVEISKNLLNQSPEYLLGTTVLILGGILLIIASKIKSKDVVFVEKDMSELNKKLFKAIVKGDNKKVVEYLASGADANTQDEFGYTVLMCASQRGHVNIVKILIDAGADIDNKDNEFGYTALKLAKREEIKKILKHRKKEITEEQNNNVKNINKVGQLKTIIKCRACGEKLRVPIDAIIKVGI